MIKVRHIAIMVTDLDKSVAFYRDILGLSYVRALEVITNKAVDLTDGETNLRLISAKNAGAPIPNGYSSVGYNHIGFIVDDIHSTYQRLKEFKVRFLSQAPADFFKISDPDGLVIDITCPERGW
jgi:catechol 2,3-dioxygenase-like lactoylglutathione lyase family enzyme